MLIMHAHLHVPPLLFLRPISAKQEERPCKAAATAAAGDYDQGGSLTSTLLVGPTCISLTAAVWTVFALDITRGCCRVIAARVLCTLPIVCSTFLISAALVISGIHGSTSRES